MIKLVKIPDEIYPMYRSDVIFNGYKWDPQVGDHNTVSDYVLVMDQKTADYLDEQAEKLSEETMNLEETVLTKPDLIKKLGLPRKIQKALLKIKNYSREDNIRLMRFDFHPTTTGWMVSEVNSDVPGGYAEGSILPEIACKYLPNVQPHHNLGNELLKAFIQKVPENGHIGLVYATSYSDDRQVMQFFGDLLKKNNRFAHYLAPDHLTWTGSGVSSLLTPGINLAAILRFFPLEWLITLPHKAYWQNYFTSGVASCNHPITITTQSKRLPLIWDKLNVPTDTWKKLLPKTVDPRMAKGIKGNWIYKPALGRVGEAISIKKAITEKEYKNILKAVKRNPKYWVAQEMFDSLPLPTQENTEMHLCVGVFTVNGKRAGFYGRICPYPRIDANAKDIPILILKE